MSTVRGYPPVNSLDPTFEDCSSANAGGTPPAATVGNHLPWRRQRKEIRRALESLRSPDPGYSSSFEGLVIFAKDHLSECTRAEMARRWSTTPPVVAKAQAMAAAGTAGICARMRRGAKVALRSPDPAAYPSTFEGLVGYLRERSTLTTRNVCGRAWGVGERTVREAAQIAGATLSNKPLVHPAFAERAVLELRAERPGPFLAAEVTERIKATLLALKDTHSEREIAAPLGIRLRRVGSAYRALGIEKPHLSRGTSIRRQGEFVRTHYLEMTDQQLAEAIGCGRQAVRELRHRLGLARDGRKKRLP